MKSDVSHDSIFAVSSGAGRAAISVIRLSGPHVRFAVETIVGRVPKPRHAQLARLFRPTDDAVLDEALVLFFPGPHSETGEDVAEFQVHGSRAVVSAVLAVLADLPGMRPAEPGEFARRALLNGKMSLLDVEALADLVDSETEWQRRQAVEGGGSLLYGIAGRWRETILSIRADLETDIDFLDEGDVQAQFDSTAKRQILALAGDMDRVLVGAQRGERLREGYRVVIAGPPNAGKSSLLNAIAGRDVAIVSAVPGTTRDRIEISLDLNGVPVLLSDTAGLQETDDLVEQEGIRRARSAMEEADLVVWLCPAGSALTQYECKNDARVRIVRSKADLASGEHTDVWRSVSVRDSGSVAALLKAVEDEAAAFFGAEPATVTRSRHRVAIETARAGLLRALAVADEPELAAEELRAGSVALDSLIGRVDVEDVLGAIFSRFCIGK